MGIKMESYLFCIYSPASAHLRLERKTKTEQVVRPRPMGALLLGG